MTHTQLRFDLIQIAKLVKKNSRVLELGCGNGELLYHLTHERQVDARGIEILQSGVSACVQSGLSVIQGDVEEDLLHYPTGCFDYVISSEVLQATHHPKDVLDHMLRVGKHVIISIPNFGYWRNRSYLMYKGQMPVTKSLSYQWYETPNIHFCTLKDFELLCKTLHAQIEKKLFLGADGRVLTVGKRCLAPNWFADKGIFLLKRDK